MLMINLMDPKYYFPVKGEYRHQVKNAEIAEVEDQTAKEVEAKKGPKFEIYKDKKGEFRFRLKAGNGQIIAVGEGYKDLAACKKGVTSIKKNAPGAAIVDAE